MGRGGDVNTSLPYRDLHPTLKPLRWEYHKNYVIGLAGTNRKVTRETNIVVRMKVQS